MRKIFAAWAVLLILVVNTTTAIAPSKPREITSFEPVTVTRIPVIADREFPGSTVGPRPQENVKPKPIIKVLTTPKPVVHNRGSKIYGIASWYCLSGVSRCTYTHSGGNYAAIRKDLVPLLNGKYIKVCTITKCITIRVIDCNCGANANLIDLYSDAFRQLAPLSAGRIKVYIEY